jgi:hypothetical protein
MLVISHALMIACYPLSIGTCVRKGYAMGVDKSKFTGGRADFSRFVGNGVAGLNATQGPMASIRKEIASAGRTNAQQGITMRNNFAPKP